MFVQNMKIPLFVERNECKQMKSKRQMNETVKYNVIMSALLPIYKPIHCGSCLRWTFAYSNHKHYVWLAASVTALGGSSYEKCLTWSEWIIRWNLITLILEPTQKNKKKMVFISDSFQRYFLEKWCIHGFWHVHWMIDLYPNVFKLDRLCWKKWHWMREIIWSWCNATIAK